MADLVLDTNVVSRLQGGTLEEDVYGKLRGHVLHLTFVTMAEMLQGAFKASWGGRRLSGLDRWLSHWSVIHSDDAVCRSWAAIVSSRTRLGKPLPYNDSWIAACCVAAEFPLLTLDRRHFEEIDGLELT